MTRLEEKFSLDDPDIRLMLPGWELFSSTGKKVCSWVKAHPEIANNLWRHNLIRVVQQSHHPHCRTCKCKKKQDPPPRLLNLEDVRNLRIIQLPQVLEKDDALVRDSYNAPLPPTESWDSAPPEVGPSIKISLSGLLPDPPSPNPEGADVPGMSSSSDSVRIVRYRSSSPPVTQPSQPAQAAHWSPPPATRREGARSHRLDPSPPPARSRSRSHSSFRKKLKKTKKKKRSKSRSPARRSRTSKSRSSSYTWSRHRSRSPPRPRSRCRASWRRSSPKGKRAERFRAKSSAQPPRVRSPTPPRLPQVRRRSRVTPPARDPSPVVRKEAHFRREDEQFHPHRPRVGKKTLPVVNLDEPQDEIVEIQQLTGGNRAIRKDEPDVLECGPVQHGDGITLLSAGRIVNRHQPAQLSPVKAEESDVEIEGGSPGSPSYSPPRIQDEPEFGAPYDPLSSCSLPNKSQWPGCDQGTP